MSSAQLAEENKDMEWDAYERKKEIAGLEECLFLSEAENKVLKQQMTALRHTYEADDGMTAAEWAEFPTMQEDLTALEKRHAELQQVPLPPPPPLLCPDLRGVCTRRLRPFRRRNAPWTRT
jgi:uncharacterized protein YaaN involved in tellurite resistance